MPQEHIPGSPGGHSSDSSDSVKAAPPTAQDFAPTSEKGGDFLGDGKIELTEADCYDELGFGFTEKKKWTILTLIFLVQVSMNFNTSLYGNAVPGMTKEFGISAQAARCGAMIFLVLYAFGCELWAPWYVSHLTAGPSYLPILVHLPLTDVLVGRKKSDASPSSKPPSSLSTSSSSPSPSLPISPRSWSVVPLEVCPPPVVPSPSG